MDDIPDNWKISGNDEIVGMPTESHGLIVTGLGGKARKLRYFVVISAAENVSLKPSFKRTIDQKFDNLFPKTKVIIENVVVESDHIRIQLLINMDHSVEEIVMPVIQTINKTKDQLLRHYFVVNTNVPSDTEIQKYVDEVRNSKRV